MTPEQRERFAPSIKRMGGDHSILPVVAKMTMQDVPDLVAETEHCVRANEVQDVAATVHKLKGSLSTFDSGGVLRSIDEVILACKAGNAADMTAAWECCKPKVERLIEEISELCECERISAG